MVQTLRKPEILNLARREGKVTVDGLVAHFGVTPQTIRRDLTELASDGALDRVYGGAVMPSTVSNIGYEDRRLLNSVEKSKIAQTCANAIPNECSIFLNIGTTTEAIARALLGHRDLLVVTNNLNVALILADNPNVEVVVSAGNLRRADGGLVGALAINTIRQFQFDLAVIGCSALSESGDILDYDIQEVGVSKAILEQSDKVYLAADHSKFERKAPCRIGTLSELDAFFTDRAVSDDLLEHCQSAKTKLFYPEDLAV